ncbi:MAG: glycosyltransferase [Crocinitomicaceae bacterium]|nr:glycosyltransferase [Crocinitomicaceae bacterium]MBP6032363.1 glycosyltransferase [Crocinitomicaceae bacterium]
MSQIINIIHKKKGGVWEVVKRLQDQGNYTTTANFQSVFNLFNKRQSKLFFHQPTSHLFSLLFFFLGFPRENITVVLHESVSYNYNLTVKSFVKVQIRFMVIRLVNILGIRIITVSEFISKSYKLNNIQKVDYSKLFMKEIDLFKDNYAKIPKDSRLAIAWLRPGTHKKTAEVILKLIANHNVSKIVLLGNLVEIKRTKIELNEKVPKVDVEFSEFLPKNDFYKLLQKSLWFISTYDKEGFGLSIFEASKFGCICLSPPSGAVLEWLPKPNFLIYQKILLQESLEDELLIKAIEKNLQ